MTAAVSSDGKTIQMTVSCSAYLVKGYERSERPMPIKGSNFVFQSLSAKWADRDLAQLRIWTRNPLDLSPGINSMISTM